MRSPKRSDPSPIRFMRRSTLMIHGYLILLLYAALFASPGTSRAEQATQDCAEMLASAPFVELDGQTVMSISSHILGEPLIGSHCPPTDIISYFEERGWEVALKGPSEPYNSIMRHSRADYFVNLCLPRAIPLRWLIKRCRAVTLIHFTDEELVELKSEYSL